jgi:hypothetical protein
MLGLWTYVSMKFPGESNGLYLGAVTTETVEIAAGDGLQAAMLLEVEATSKLLLSPEATAPGALQGRSLDSCTTQVYLFMSWPMWSRRSHVVTSLVLRHAPILFMGWACFPSVASNIQEYCGSATYHTLSRRGTGCGCNSIGVQATSLNAANRFESTLVGTVHGQMLSCSDARSQSQACGEWAPF